MPVRLGQFYAFLLLLTCLSINIAFFPEVREPFLGDDDPVSSTKLALSESDFTARIAEFYPTIQARVQDLRSVLPLPGAQKQKEPEKTSELPTDIWEPDIRVPWTVTDDPIVDSFFLPSQPPVEEPEVISEEEEPEAPEPVFSVVAPETSGMTQQTSAVVPVASPAVVRPVVADQFKPIIIPVESVRPPAGEETKRASNASAGKSSSNVVWDTIDTVLERPIRYDL